MMRDTKWGFALVEALHLLGLTLLGGALLVGHLTQAQILFSTLAAKPVIDGVLKTGLTGLSLTFLSGVLMLSAKPARYYFDDIFRIKIAVLILALSISAFLIRSSTQSAPGPLVRISAVVSLALWLGVGALGRLIGFF
jgi:hypothetical protein